MQRTTLPATHPTAFDCDAEAVHELVRDQLHELMPETLYGVALALGELHDRPLEPGEPEDPGEAVPERLQPFVRTLFRRLDARWEDRFETRVGMLKAFALAAMAVEAAGGVDAELEAYRAERAGEAEGFQAVLDAAVQPGVVSAVGCVLPATAAGPEAFSFVLLDAAGQKVDGLTISDDPGVDRPLSEAVAFVGDQLTLRGVRVSMQREATS